MIGIKSAFCVGHWLESLPIVAPRWRTLSRATDCWPQWPQICPSSEDFVSYNGLRPQGASIIYPSSEDFVLYNGLRPQGSQDLPLIGGLCLVATDFDHKGHRADKRNNNSSVHKTMTQHVLMQKCRTMTWKKHTNRYRNKTASQSDDNR